MWQTSEYHVDDNITLLTMVNMPRFNTYGAYINYSPTFFGCWHPSIMAGINAQDFKIAHNGKSMSLDRPNGENCYVKPYWQCNLGLYKSFGNETWSIKLQLNDIFDTWRQEVTLYDAISSTSSEKIYDTRDLSLTIRYNFNSTRSRYKGHGAENSDKNRF